MNPIVTRVGFASIQVCVPTDWTDAQVLEFANREHPTGFDDDGWEIRREGDEHERVTCEKHPENVHIVLDC